MEKEFCTRSQSLALKELGFEIKSPYWYNRNGVLLIKSFECDDETISVNVNDIIEYWDNVIEDRIDVPTFSQAFRWFREKYDLGYSIKPYVEQFKRSYLACIYENLNIKALIDDNRVQVRFALYEEAESACLDKLIEIVKRKENEKI